MIRIAILHSYAGNIQQRRASRT